ncbi:TlpA family protein disulfide reductase [Carboxylicivirga sediminis]|uniref:TlpA family protein disulfide reductase n=1 Tax=Carboxylicivirga sediminis TaxID=2006564 RepID=A0A941F502_9BACT|nr:TlpA disulfide reductase family protein [Carboxylicivirga sediminis]MBR8536958.1 TlpA family protein disulfide reductase [Carboxylicivirga sediminis]
MNRLLPLSISAIFSILLITSNVIARWQQSAIFRQYETIDEPLRCILEQDEFLADESNNRIYVINLWATWCPPCMKEIPHLNQLVDKYEEDGVLFLAINGEKEKDVVEWMDYQKNDFIYFHLHNQKQLMNYLFELNPNETHKTGQKPQHLPTNIIISNGELTFFNAGYSDEALVELEHALKKCLMTHP